MLGKAPPAVATRLAVFAAAHARPRPILLGLTSGRRLQLILKHGFDRLFALLAIVLLSPLLLVLVLWVRSSGRPVFVRERRLGREDAEFGLLRFRCERTDLIGPRPVDNPTLTKAGAFLRSSGVEDVPQLINLLRGDISLVGPRPQRPEVLKILNAGRGLRSMMRPGITGPAQIGALRGPATPEARKDADDYYVRAWSLWLDARILGRTILAALKP